jgi:hypothetical protein
VHARNGKTFRVYFFSEGPVEQLVVTKCWYGLTPAEAGVQNGVVQRGAFFQFYFSDESAAVPTDLLAWNALGEGTISRSNKLCEGLPGG